MPIDLGSAAPVLWERGTANGGHSVTLTLVRPDGTTVDPVDATDLGAGKYEAELAATQPGRYVLRWHDVDANTWWTDTREVWPTDPRFLISLEDAYSGLKWNPASIAADGEKLRLYIAAATDVIEDITGAILIRSIEQPSDGGRTGVLLWERPLGDVTVTVDGKPYTGHRVNHNAGIVYASARDEYFPPGRQNILITYRTGTEQVSPSIQLAARELVRHLWQVGQQAQQSSEPVHLNAKTTGLTRSGFAVPNRVIELCGNQHALPGLG